MLVDRLAHDQNIHVFVAIDELGICHSEFIQGKYTSDYYMDVLRRLHKKVGKGRPVALLYDGLSLHKTKAATSMLVDEFGWLPLLNIAYSPRNNPCEALFAIVKRVYRAKFAHVNAQLMISGSSEKLPFNRKDIVAQIIDDFKERDNSKIIYASR